MLKLMRQNYKMSFLACIFCLGPNHIYPDTLKNWELNKEAFQNFCLEHMLTAERKSASEDKNFEPQLTQSKNHFSNSLNMQDLETAAVTYEIPGGRFGDQLIAYMHAKWISYVHGIPLLYKPFSYSNNLVLDDVEELFRASRSFQYVVQIQNMHTIEENRAEDILYITPYFPESAYELKLMKWPYFPVNWKDPQFLSLLRGLICPKTPFPTKDLPYDRVAVALHVRKGGGFDDPALQNHWPLKFPPDDFYIAQIRKMHEMLKKPLFVHIFTDDPAPSAIAEHYAKALSDIDILFDYRMEGNRFNAHVLADLFDMMRYECLIRPESNYSIVAEKLGEFHIVIHPTQCIVKGKQITITDVHIEIAFDHRGIR